MDGNERFFGKSGEKKYDGRILIANQPRDAVHKKEINLKIGKAHPLSRSPPLFPSFFCAFPISTVFPPPPFPSISSLVPRYFTRIPQPIFPTVK